MPAIMKFVPYFSRLVLSGLDGSRKTVRIIGTCFRIMIDITFINVNDDSALKSGISTW